MKSFYYENKKDLINKIKYYSSNDKVRIKFAKIRHIKNITNL